MGPVRRVLLWGSESRWLRERLPRYAFARRAVARFMPGEELGDALEAAAGFGAAGVGTVITALGENVADRDEAAAVARHYVEALSEVARRGIDCEISVKPTQLGFDLDPALCAEGVAAVAASASELDNVVWIDMEGSAYTEATLELYREVRGRWRNAGLCLQSYLRRTAGDLEALLPLSPAIRLVKGAYAEPPALAYTRKAEVDERYYLLARRLLEERAAGRPVRAAFATHDTRLIARIRDAADALDLPPDAYEFQMLYGIRREAQVALAAAGCTVRVLISYGTAWFPWFMRRLAERPANVWFLARSLTGG